MTNFNFEFFPSYKGKWQIEGINEITTGTLSLNETSITLEVLFHEDRLVSIHDCFVVRGDAFNNKSNGKKSEVYHFLLYNCRILSTSLFCNNLNRLVFDVDSILISTKEFNFEHFNQTKLDSCVTRISMLDKWLAPIYTNKYSLSDEAFTSEQFEMSFKNPASLTLFEDDNMRIYVRFSFGFNYPNETGFSLTNKTFVNIDFKKKTVDFDTAHFLLDQVVNFFMLIWNYTFEPDYLGFRHDGNTYWWKRSKKYSHKYFEEHPNAFRADFEDFPDLPSYLNLWLSLYNQYEVALSEYFDAIVNEYAHPSSILRSLVSVIDGLTKDLNIKSNGHISDSKKQKKILDIINKINGLDKDELNFIKTQALRETSTNLIPRFNVLIKDIEVFMYIPDDFAYLIVNTRNNLTHVNKKSSTPFIGRERFSQTVLVLENIIRAYLMKHIGIPYTTIKKTVQLYGNFNIS